MTILLSMYYGLCVKIPNIDPYYSLQCKGAIGKIVVIDDNVYTINTLNKFIIKGCPFQWLIDETLIKIVPCE